MLKLVVVRHQLVPVVQNFLAEGVLLSIHIQVCEGLLGAIPDLGQVAELPLVVQRAVGLRE